MKNNITGTASITINAPAGIVWKALTDPRIIKQYLFGTEANSDWKVGSPITFMGEWEGKQYVDKGMIKEVKANKLLRYTYWSSMSGLPDAPEHYVDITYELEEADGKTKLTVVQENIADERTKEVSQQNWTTVLEGMKELLEE